MTQRDVVLRWIEQIVQVVRRMLAGPGPVDLDLAGEQVDEAIEQLLGPLALLVPRLDVPSAAALISDADRLTGLSQLLDLRGAIEQANGHLDAAERTLERGAAFRNEALRRTDSG
jgi:hypothetical protein